MTTTSQIRYDPNASFSVKTIDFIYRRAGDLELLARVYQPEGEGPFPVMVDVHGGAWAAQSHLFSAGSQEALAKTGVVVMAADFRSSNIAPHPAAMEDISYAVRWLKAHAAEYNGSAEHVGIFGRSSGGHLTMLGAMRPQEYATIPLAEAPQLDARVAYVIMTAPVIDPLARYEMARDAGNEGTMKRHLEYFGDEARQIALSPTRMLERGEPAQLPPVLIVQGGADEGVPRMMAERFVEVYNLAGGMIELGKYPGEPHAFMQNVGPNTLRARAQIQHFIARILADATEASVLSETEQSRLL
jgi:acetyl esterase